VICYLDTSALVKLYVREEGSEAVRELVDAVAVVATAKVAYAEARAALARGFREGLLEARDYRLVVAALQDDWARYLALELSDPLIWLAGELAEKHRLRGFDAVHLAAAVTLQARVKGRVVVACWDARLWEALRASDLDVVPKVRPSTG